MWRAIRSPRCGAAAGTLREPMMMNHPGAESSQQLPWQIVEHSCQMDAELLGYTTALLSFIIILLLLFSLNLSQRWKERVSFRWPWHDWAPATPTVCLHCTCRKPRNISHSFASKQTRNISLAWATINLRCRDQSQCRLGKILSDMEVSEVRWGVPPAGGLKPRGPNYQDSRLISEFQVSGNSAFKSCHYF